MAMLPAAAAPEMPGDMSERAARIVAGIAVGQRSERAEKRAEGTAAGVPNLLQMTGDIDPGLR